MKELKKYKVQHEIQVAKESEVAYKSKQAEIENWKNKYLALLEKYNQLLERTASRKKGIVNKKITHGK